MTNGESVRLRLARGGTYPGDILYRQAGGGPDNTHLVIAGPGTGPLPIIEGTWQIGIQSTPISRLTVKNLQFPARGPNVLGSGEHLTLRGLVVAGAEQGITVQGENGLRWSDVAINRCRVMDITGADHAQGFYGYAIDGLKIVDSVFDHAVSPLDELSHHAYIQNGCTGVIVRRNIFSRASSHALQLRPGGEASNNLVLDCPIGILFGGGTNPETAGIMVNGFSNVVLGGGNIDPTGANLPRGWAYYLENCAGGVLTDNIAANGQGGDQRGLTKDGSLTVLGNPEVGVLNVSGINSHQNHGTVHTDAGDRTGTTVSLISTPITGVDLSMAALGLTWDDIRAGLVQPAAVIQLIKQLLGTSTPPKSRYWESYLTKAGVRLPNPR